MEIPLVLLDVEWIGGYAARPGVQTSRVVVVAVPEHVVVG